MKSISPLGLNWRRSRFPRWASMALALSVLLTGCGKLTVSSVDGEISATSGSNTTIYWTFFNQDFKDFAASRVSADLPHEDVYDIASVSHPDIQYFRIQQDITGASTVSGSGDDTVVTLKVSNLVKQLDGVTLSPSEAITFLPPAFGFTWLLGGRSTVLSDFDASDLCGLFVMASSQTWSRERDDFYRDIGLTSDVYSCSQPTTITTGGASPEERGHPGISFTVNQHLVGRDVEGSPVYIGADSIFPLSTYRVVALHRRGVFPATTVLTEGQVDIRGNFSSTLRLPLLPDSVRALQMTATNSVGLPLTLSSSVAIESGIFSAIG